MNDTTTWEHPVRSGAAGIEMLRLSLLQALQPLAPSPRCVYALELVLEEWLTNVARHGRNPDAVVRVQLALTPDEVVLRFEDDAAPFDPQAMPEPAPARSLDVAQPGGLGLAMMRRMTRSLEHGCEDGRNVLVARVARH